MFVGNNSSQSNLKEEEKAAMFGRTINLNRKIITIIVMRAELAAFAFQTKSTLRSLVKPSLNNNLLRVDPSSSSSSTMAPPRKKKAINPKETSTTKNGNEVPEKMATRPRSKKKIVKEESEDDEVSEVDESPSNSKSFKRQRAAITNSSNSDNDDNDGDEGVKQVTKRSKVSQVKTKDKSTKKSNKPVVKESKSDEKQSNVEVDYGKKGSLKIVSWNINGIRAWLPKGGLDYLKQEDPDVLCVQETKCSEDKLPKELESLKDYKSYFLAGDKEGYSGVGVLSKLKPIKVSFGINMKEHDAEGRVITMEFEEFFLVNVYVPNAGRGLVRLDYRMKWDKDFRTYLTKLKDKKDVILTGDLNVAHEEIDLANPKSNKRNAGFTQEERDGFSSLLKEGFIDTFRKLYPDRTQAYTFWTYMMNARARNVGWRLDYFVVNESFMERVVDNEIRDKVMGSDHCPIVLHIN